jgi:hypothetical protein
VGSKVFLERDKTLCFSGTDVMNLKIFLPKKMAFFAQTTESFCKKNDHNIGF